ncbi:MAG: HNH endonuclease [Nitrospinae bacterium]|nr:HNH endonuclease [Nitrospinota bacterium]
MKFELEEYHRGVTDEELIADLRRVASELKKTSITNSDYGERGKYHIATYLRRFGSWFIALEKAGLEKSRNFNITQEELFQNLEEVWIKLGRQPRYSEVKIPLSKYGGKTYENRFGTWRKALESFVASINNLESIASEAALEAVRVEPSTRHKTKRDINWRLRFIVMRRDNFKCKSCGRSPATDSSVILHVDHVKAWANGGETVIENLQTLCSICNIGKSDLQ